MPPHPDAEFGITEARRILGEVFAPWVQDLNLSVERIEHTPPADVPDWQPGALLRMPFSERLCRNGGVVCGQALMALADTAMVIANLAANRGYRPMIRPRISCARSPRPTCWRMRAWCGSGAP